MRGTHTDSVVFWNSQDILTPDCPVLRGGLSAVESWALDRIGQVLDRIKTIRADSPHIGPGLSGVEKCKSTEK
jgi:hypothetical protein